MQFDRNEKTIEIKMSQKSSSKYLAEEIIKRDIFIEFDTRTEMGF